MNHLLNIPARYPSFPRKRESAEVGDGAGVGDLVGVATGVAGAVGDGASVEGGIVGDGAGSGAGVGVACSGVALGRESQAAENATATSDRTTSRPILIPFGMAGTNDGSVSCGLYHCGICSFCKSRLPCDAGLAIHYGGLYNQANNYKRKAWCGRPYAGGLNQDISRFFVFDNLAESRLRRSLTRRYRRQGGLSLPSPAIPPARLPQRSFRRIR